MDDVIVFIPHDMESELIKKSAELFRIHQMAKDIKHMAVVIVEPNQMTLQELALLLVKDDLEKLDKLNEQMEDFNNSIQQKKHKISVLLSSDKQQSKHKNFIQKPGIKQYNMVKQRHKQIFFNRTIQK